MNPFTPTDVYRLRDTNEKEVAHAVKLIEQKKEKLKLLSKAIKEEVDNLQHENVLIEKDIKYTASCNAEIEKSILILKTKTCESASSIENVEWKIFKTDMLKLFEIAKNETTINKKNTYNQHVHPQKIVCDLTDSENTNNDDLKMLNESIKQLKEEVEKSKSRIETHDSKLDFDIQMLLKRNGALLIRYERQLQEAERRLRQMHSELNSLKILLSEKEALLKL